MTIKNNLASVAIARCKEYNSEDVEKAVKKCIDLLGGASSFIKNGDKVLLKPNMFRPSTTGTTHPSVVRAIAEIFLDAGAKIYLTDSPMMHSLEEVARTNGIEKICKDLKIEMTPIGTVKKNLVEKPKRSKVFFLPTLLDEIDLIINIPKIKAHPLTIFSGSVKNIFGLCAGLTKSQFHLKFKRRQDFCQMLLDLYSTICPGLTIMDAVNGVDSKGSVKKVGAILGSKDAIALDATACRIIGIPPDIVMTTKFGSERKLGVMEKENIQTIGDPLPIPSLNDFEFEVNRHEVISSISISLFDSFFLKNNIGKPKITKKCEKCGLCANVCPKNAITLKGKIAQIDPSRCIRCYCCQEICPNEAVVIKEANSAFRLFTTCMQNIVLKMRSFESRRRQ